MIKREYGIMFNTIYFFFKRHGIDLRSVSSAHTLAIKNGRWSVHANCKYKNGHHITWFGDEIYYKSSYEKRVIDILDEIKEIYLYENVRLSYYLSCNKERIYVSDFYIPRLNLILETKSEWFQKTRKREHIAKEEAVINEGYKFKMVGNKEISKFEIDKNISVFMKSKKNN